MALVDVARSGQSLQPGHLVISLLSLLALCQISHARYGCRDLDGKPVDWFVALKLSGNKEYVMSDSNLKEAEWRKEKGSLDDTSAGIAATLKQIYNQDTSAFNLLYSDDGPVKKSEGYRAHAKGALLFDGTSGFWMIHSVPNFPPLYNYSYPETGVKFGQSFLCVTLPTEQLANVGEQLMFMQATPFLSNLPERFAARFPVLRTVIAKKSLAPSATVFTSVKRLTTVAGVEFISYSKHKKFKKDIWQDLVAAESRTSLGVESWLNGNSPDLHSNCGKDFNIYDVTMVSLPGAGNFSSSMDHSKWAVADKSTMPMVCIGDMNRQKAQLTRGGGAVCTMNAGLWRIFKAAVVDVEECKPSHGTGIHWQPYLCALTVSVQRALC